MQINPQCENENGNENPKRNDVVDDDNAQPRIKAYANVP